MGINARDNKVKIRQERLNLAYSYYFVMDGRILIRKKKFLCLLLKKVNNNSQNKECIWMNFKS